MAEVPSTIITPDNSVLYATALRELCAEVGMERFVKGCPIRDLLDALTGPSMDWLDRQS